MIDVDYFKMGGFWALRFGYLVFLLRGRKMIHPCEATYRSLKMIAVYRCVPLVSLETGYSCTPLKINMEHNHAGLEDHFPFKMGDLKWFVGFMLIFQGVNVDSLFQDLQVQVPASSQGASEAYLLRVSWGARMKRFESGGVTGPKVWMLEKMNID